MERGQSNQEQAGTGMTGGHGCKDPFIFCTVAACMVFIYVASIYLKGLSPV